MISGKAGVGKTWFALDFEKVYYIDTEGGAVRARYREKLQASDGVYMGKEQGSQDFQVVIEEIKALATTTHHYKTLVIDSFSQLYNTAAAIAEEKFGNSFGRDKKEANRPTRQLLRWLEALDMTVIFICHQKDKWERRGGEVVQSGSTFDGFDKMEYMLDLWIEADKKGKDNRFFIVKKSRIYSFPEGDQFPLEYVTFSELYGKEVIEKEPVPVKMATPAQVGELVGLLDIVKIEPEQTEKWKRKANVDSWEEMTESQVLACLSFLKKKIAGTGDPKLEKEVN